MRHYDVPGISIALIRNYQLVWVKALGNKTKSPISPVSTESLFQAGSISKPITAISVLRQAETGHLSLDTPVNQLLTSWKIPASAYTETTPVLVRHLLNHTAGLTVHGFAGYRVEDQVPDLLNILDGEPPANSAKLVVNRPVGNSYSYRYSGGGYTVLEQLLEDHFKSDFTHFMQENVLSIMNLKHSTFEQPLAEMKWSQIAWGYPRQSQKPRGQFYIHPEQAAAGLWTTAGELAQVIIELQKSLKDDSGKLLTQQSAKSMLHPAVYGIQGSSVYGIGLGIFVNDFYFLHAGWNEGYSSKFIAHQEKGYGLVVLTNANKPQLVEEVITSIARSEGWDDF